MAPRSELLLRPPNRADWARGPTGPRGSRRRCCRPNPNLTLNSKKPPTHAHLPSTKKRVHPLSSVRYDAAAADAAAARRRRSCFSGRRYLRRRRRGVWWGWGPLGEGGRGEGQGPPWNAAAKPRHPLACAEASESAAASSGCSGPSRRRRWQPLARLLESLQRCCAALAVSLRTGMPRPVSRWGRGKQTSKSKHKEENNAKRQEHIRKIRQEHLEQPDSYMY